MSFGWLLALLLVLSGCWVLRTWLLWDRRREREGDVARASAVAAEPARAASGTEVIGGEGTAPEATATEAGGPEVSDGAEGERRAERFRQALRERGEQVLDADRLSEQSARLAWLDRTLANLEADPAPGQGVETSRLRGELAALERREAPAETTLRSLERRVESLREASEPTGDEASRPALFETPRERDDLKRIKGIGPVMEEVLNSHGVTTFRQLASFSAEDIERVSEAIGTFPGRIERDDWVGKARRLLREERDRTP